MKSTTKKAQSLLWSYDHSRYNSVLNAYTKPSAKKVAIERDIMSDMQKLNGYGYKVCSKSCHMFSCAFKYENIDKQTGEVTEHMRYYTKCNTYDIEL